MGKILVPTDFSDSSLRALDVAVELSKVTGWSITLMNIIKSADLVKSTYKSLRDETGSNKVLVEAKGQLESIRNKPKYKGLKISIEISLQNSITKLSEEIGDQDADLIVMGTKEIAGYADEKLIGKNTRELIKQAACPVLVVKKPLKKLDIQSVVFTTDFDKKHRDILNNLAPLINALNAKLHLLCVSSPNAFITSRKVSKLLDNMMNKTKIKSWDFTLYNDKSKEDGILHFAEDFKADMLIMPTHGRKGFDYFFNGSIAEEVLDHFDGLGMTIYQKN